MEGSDHPIQDAIERETRESGERRLSIVRFTELNQVYETDLKRLASIEEGGVVLLAMAKRPCPFCGADPEHQRHDHGVAEAQATYDAAKLEMAKIVRDQTLLLTTIASVQGEIVEDINRLEKLRVDLKGCESQLSQVRPQESSLRGSYETLSGVRREVSGRLELLQEKARLNTRKEALIAEGKAAPKSLKLTVGPSGPVGHELAQTVQGVLFGFVKGD